MYLLHLSFTHTDAINLDPSGNLIGQLRLLLEDDKVLGTLRALYPEYYAMCTIYKLINEVVGNEQSDFATAGQGRSDIHKISDSVLSDFGVRMKATCDDQQMSVKELIQQVRTS